MAWWRGGHRRYHLCICQVGLRVSLPLDAVNRSFCFVSLFPSDRHTSISSHRWSYLFECFFYKPCIPQLIMCIFDNTFTLLFLISLFHILHTSTHFPTSQFTRWWISSIHRSSFRIPYWLFILFSYPFTFYSGRPSHSSPFHSISLTDRSLFSILTMQILIE